MNNIITIPTYNCNEINIVLSYTTHYKNSNNTGITYITWNTKPNINISFLSGLSKKEQEKQYYKTINYFEKFKDTYPIIDILKYFKQEYPVLIYDRFLSKIIEEEHIIDSIGDNYSVIFCIKYLKIREQIISYIEQKINVSDNKIDELKDIFNINHSNTDTFEEYLDKKAKYLLNLNSEHLLKDIQNNAKRQFEKRKFLLETNEEVLKNG
jgi:hypothetical protein